MVLVGCNCNLPASYLPRVVARVATVSILAHLRYLQVRISIVLRLLDILSIDEVGVSGSRKSYHLRHVVPHVALRLRCHIRI